MTGCRFVILTGGDGSLGIGVIGLSYVVQGRTQSGDLPKTH